jgi:hypothetical protein
VQSPILTVFPDLPGDLPVPFFFGGGIAQSNIFPPTRLAPVVSFFIRSYLSSAFSEAVDIFLKIPM